MGFQEPNNGQEGRQQAQGSGPKHSEEGVHEGGKKVTMGDL